MHSEHASSCEHTSLVVSAVRIVARVAGLACNRCGPLDDSVVCLLLAQPDGATTRHDALMTHRMAQSAPLDPRGNRDAKAFTEAIQRKQTDSSHARPRRPRVECASRECATDQRGQDSYPPGQKMQYNTSALPCPYSSLVINSSNQFLRDGVARGTCASRRGRCQIYSARYVVGSRRPVPADPSLSA